MGVGVRGGWGAGLPDGVVLVPTQKYTIGGDVVPGVTTVIGVINRPFLAQWRGRVGNEEADRISHLAMDYGTKVHGHCQAWLEAHAQGWVYTAYSGEYSPAVRDAVGAFIEWATTHLEVVHHVERPVLYDSHGMRYGGTPDLICSLRDGRSGVVDFKTSKQIDRLYGLQLSAYRHAWAGPPLDFSAVLRLPRGGSMWEWREFPDDAADFGAFLSALHLYNWLNANGEL